MDVSIGLQHPGDVDYESDDGKRVRASAAARSKSLSDNLSVLKDWARLGGKKLVDYLN